MIMKARLRDERKQRLKSAWSKFGRAVYWGIAAVSFLLIPVLLVWSMALLLMDAPVVRFAEVLAMLAVDTFLNLVTSLKL